MDADHDAGIIISEAYLESFESAYLTLKLLILCCHCSHVRLNCAVSSQSLRNWLCCGTAFDFGLNSCFTQQVFESCYLCFVFHSTSKEKLHLNNNERRECLATCTNIQMRQERNVQEELKYSIWSVWLLECHWEKLESSDYFHKWMWSKSDLKMSHSICFFFLVTHYSDLICATCEQRIRIGSHQPCSLAKVRSDWPTSRL